MSCRFASTLVLSLVAAAAGPFASPARAAEDRVSDPGGLAELNQRINDQVRRLAELRRSLEREEAGLQEMRRLVADRLLATQRGGAAAPLAATVPGTGPVGVAPEGNLAANGAMATTSDGRLTAVAPIFEEPGVLTAKGSYVLEPSLQYSYSSNNRVTLVGYTVIPSLLVGLIDVRDVNRNTTVAALTGRYGLTNRWELEARVPYVYRSDSTRSREIATGTAVDRVIDATGSNIGDVELAARYQLTRGSAEMPYLIGSLRFKSRTGTDPFEVVTDCVTRCTGNATGTGQPLRLPTGSGFYSLQPGLTWLYPSDPAVLFGTFTYLHNFARSNVSRQVLGGEQEFLGKVAPGDVFGFNVGVGIALNDRSSFSVGYDHSSVGRTRVNGDVVPGSLRTTLATLLFGYSYRLNPRTSLNFSLGAGLTPDTPGVTLAVRTPFTF